jgi:hypothetical protein
MPPTRTELHVALPVALLVLGLSWPASSLADASTLVPETGYNYGEIETARSAAMGGASRALGNAVTGLYVNPANIALTRVYHLQALAQIWPQARRQTYGLSAVDSVTGRLAGAIGGHYGVLDPDGVDRRWTEGRLALALPLSERFYVGLTGKYLKLKQSGVPLRANGLVSSYAAAGLVDQAIVDNFTFDAGITVKPTSSLFLGLLGQNLTNPGHGLLPTSFGGGVGFGTNDVTIEADLVADFTTYVSEDGHKRTTTRAMVGAEYLAADHYPLRLGYRYDSGQGTHGISGGIGYIDPQFSVDFAIRQTTGGHDIYGPSTTFVVDLQYFIESTGLTRSAGEVEQ